MAKKNKKFAKVFHHDLYGKREDKYNFLDDNNMYSIDWRELKVEEPNFFFVWKDTRLLNEYNEGFEIEKLFLINTSGITTGNDKDLVSEIEFEENNK